MQKKAVAFNIIWSFSNIAVTMLIDLLLAPYISDTVGIDAYGFVSLGNNFISYISLISSTINVFAVRYISLEYHNERFDNANSLYNSILFVNVLYGVVLLFSGVGLISVIDRLLNIPENLVMDVRILFALILVNYLITLVGTAFNAATFIKNMLYLSTRNTSISNIIRAFLLLVFFLFFETHIWYLSVAALVSSIFVVLWNIYYSYKLTPHLKVNVRMFSLAKIGGLAKTGIWNTFASLGTTLNSGLDLLVTNLFISAIAMGELSISKRFGTMVTTLLIAVDDSFRPQLLENYAHGQFDEMFKTFRFDMKCCGLICCTVFAVFYTHGLQFFSLWIPNQNYSFIFVLTVLTFTAEILVGIVKPLHYVCVLTKKLKFPCIANLVVGVANVISMLILLSSTNGGLYVVVYTTIVGNIIYNFIIMPLYVTSQFKTERKLIYKIVVRFIATTAICVCVMLLYKEIVYLEGWLGWFLSAGSAAIVAALLYLCFMLNRDEKKAVVGMVLTLLRKK